MKVNTLKMIWSVGKSMVNATKTAIHNRKPSVLAAKYSDAKQFVANVSYETWRKISMDVFEANNSKTPLLQKIDYMKSALKKHNIDVPQDVSDAISVVEHKATVFADRMKLAKSKGKTPKNVYNYGFKFRERPEIKKINNYFDDTISKFMDKWSDDIYFGDGVSSKDYESIVKELSKLRDSMQNIYSSDLFDVRIGKVSDDIIKQDQVFYHGTTSARSILKNGFMAKAGREQSVIAGRELGEGVYISPDKKVASWFAGFRGSILPLRVNTKNVAVVNNEQQNIILQSFRKYIGVNSLNKPAHLELLMKELFQRNGYNCAYSSQALGNGLFGDICRKSADIAAGGKQSQLVVFDPADIQILSKTLSDRVANHSLQLKTLFEFPINVYKSIM